MSLHISTQELDEQNLSYEEFFRVIHVILKHETMYLRQLHPSKSINDIESYPIIIEKVLKITSTLYTVVNANTFRRFEIFHTYVKAYDYNQRQSIYTIKTKAWR